MMAYFFVFVDDSYGTSCLCSEIFKQLEHVMGNVLHMPCIV